MKRKVSFTTAFCFLFLIYSSSTAYAECASSQPSINFYEEGGNPLHKMPIENQDNLSICYAFTAAQLADFELLKAGVITEHELIDPYSVAYLHKTIRRTFRSWIEWDKDVLDNSLMKWAIEDLRSYGACTRDEANANIDALNPFQSLMRADFIALVEAAFKVVQQYPQQSNAAIFKIMLEENEWIEPLIALENPVALDLKITSVLDPIRSYLNNNNGYGTVVFYLGDLVLEKCKSHPESVQSLPKIKSVGLGYYSKEGLLNTIDEVLRSGHPVGIGYCSTIYSEDAPDYGYMYTSRWLPRAAKLLDQNCEAHYSMLVGERENPETKQCEFLLRNTEGKSPWTKRWECLCGNEGSNEKTHVCATGEKQVLGCWVPEDDINSATYELEYFQ